MQERNSSGGGFCDVVDVHIPGKLACKGETNYLEREAFRQGAPAEHKVGVGARGRAKTQFAVLVLRIFPKVLG